MGSHIKMVRDSMEKVEVEAIKTLSGIDPFKTFVSRGISIRVQRATNETNLQIDPSGVPLKVQRTLVKVSPTFLQSISLPSSAAVVIKQYKNNPY